MNGSKRLRVRVWDEAGREGVSLALRGRFRRRWRSVGHVPLDKDDIVTVDRVVVVTYASDYVPELRRATQKR